MSLNHLTDIKSCQDTFQKKITQIWTLGDIFGVPIVGAPTSTSQVSFIGLGNLVSIILHPFSITIPNTGTFYSIVSLQPFPEEFRTTQITKQVVILTKNTANTSVNGVIFNYGLPEQQIHMYEGLYPNIATPLTPNEIYKSDQYQNFTLLRTEI